jgi:hypothetical protein
MGNRALTEESVAPTTVNLPGDLCQDFLEYSEERHNRRLKPFSPGRRMADPMRRLPGSGQIWGTKILRRQSPPGKVTPQPRR